MLLMIYRKLTSKKYKFKKMSLQKLFTQCDEYLRKIDQKIRMEDYKRIETTERNLSDIKILFGDFKKIVCKLV